jgi:hypothetical protein
VIHVETGGQNLPPTVTIISPSQGEVFTEPASFTFAATVTDPDDGVAFVRFYVGDNLVNALYSGPYSTEITGLATGNYTLRIEAADFGGGVTTRSVNISVQPPGQSTTITLGAPTVSNGQLQFQATGLTVGRQAVLQATADPCNPNGWTSLQTNQVSSTTMPFGPPVLAGARFFRVVQLP